MKDFIRKHSRSVLLALFGIMLILAAISSTLPDGLEWAGSKLGFLHLENPVHRAPLSDYSISSRLPFGLNQVFSALTGIIILILIFYLLKHFLPVKKSEDQHREA